MAPPSTIITVHSPTNPSRVEHSDSSDSSTSSSFHGHEHQHPEPLPHPNPQVEQIKIHAPVPTRPRLPSRKSSGPMVIPRDSDVGPVDVQFGPDDARAMSPRRTSEDIEVMSREAREELRRQAKALQDSLLAIFQRIESVREEHDKLDSNNKFLQKYIGDLMSTSKITASDNRAKK